MGEKAAFLLLLLLLSPFILALGKAITPIIPATGGRPSLPDAQPHPTFHGTFVDPSAVPVEKHQNRLAHRLLNEAVQPASPPASGYEMAAKPADGNHGIILSPNYYYLLFFLFSFFLV